ncbi:DUF6236 family protein [Pseudomonas putida]|uniref:DUF6236 family protein n=1 Tax=Pseudomonas putida TaxID=303 RepID=UPI00235CFF59|nr:DUF6236 family protein [Pseudomonas putida]GLO44146.1 hypothetical protein PPUN109347_07080 [Pseudomonas putida]HDS0979556.1 hypothetical protein [Pseudomonas putida]
MRGLIISSPVTIKDGKEIYKWESFLLDPQDLRFSIFFWDRLAWPRLEFNTMEIPVGDDALFLQSAGILERPTYFYLGNGARAKIKGYISTLEKYEEQHPGMWAMGNGANSIITESDYFESNAGTLIELLRCVPIPTQDVPLSEILEFRHKRRDELLLFRQYIEDLSLEINGSSDSVDALNKAQRNIDEACSNLWSVTREWNMPIHLSNFSTSFNLDLKKAASSAYVAWKSLSSMGLPDTTSIIGAVAAGVQSQLSVKSDVKFRPFKKSRSPFKYAFSISQHF